MTTVDQLAQDFATYQTDVQTKFEALTAQIAASNPEGIPADVQAKIDSLDAAINSADLSIKPAAPSDVPATTPAASDVPPTG